MPERSDAVPATPDHPRNLFTLLGSRYRLNVHESVTRLCPASLCPPQRQLAGIHPGFGGMLGDLVSIWWDVVAPDPSDAFAAGIGGEDFRALDAGDVFVRSLRRSRTPTVDFLHVLLPHFPWHYVPTGQDAVAFPPLPPGLVEGVWQSDHAAELGRQRHVLQTMATDGLIGRIVARLRAIDAFDDAVVVVTADHGVAFARDRPFRGVAHSTYPSIMWTPLLVKYPGQRSAVVDDRPVESVDVLPTVADVVGVRIPWSVDGRSTRGDARRDGVRPLFEWSSNVVEPDDGRYLRFDGPAGFASVLRRRATVGGGVLAPYRLGPYGGLVGEDAYPLARLEPSAARATLADPLRYQVVDDRAPMAPWATVRGTVDLPPGRTVAFTANGVVAGVYRTVRDLDDGPGRSAYYGMVAPVLAEGHNLVQLFAVDGPPARPVLHPIRIEATRPP
jgi:hypothetical protein